MKTTLRRKPFSSGFLSFCVSLLLTAALTTPAPATVFTSLPPINLPDTSFSGIGKPYASNIVVPDLGGDIEHITVTLHNINHTWPDDLDILLVGPVTSNNIILMSDAGGGDDTYNKDITFDDTGGVLPDNAVLTSGVFKPANYFGTGSETFPAPAPPPSSATSLFDAFNGSNSAGTWSLYVVDDEAVDIGTIGNGWSLAITVGSTTTTFSNVGAPIHSGDGQRGIASPYGSTIKVTRMPGAITDVNVTLSGLTHTNPDDLDILLVGPSGKRILLLSDAGGITGVGGINMTFDDSATAGAPDAGTLFTGTFKPTNFGLNDTLPYLPVIYPSPSAAGGATLESVFNGTKPNGVWRLYIVDDTSSNAGIIANGWSIDITTGGMYGASRFTNTDFDGDGLSDTAVYNLSTGTWYLRDSSTTNKRTIGSFSQPGDIPVPGDYDGDGKTDLARYRPGNGQWYIRLSSLPLPISTIFVKLGTMGDIPVPQDYDGNGTTDIALFQPAGTWLIKPGLYQRATYTVAWGLPGDIPVRGHFFGKDAADFAVFHPQDGTWSIRGNGGPSFSIQFGVSTDQPVPGDYDGDGKTDVAVYRPSSGDWFILNSAGSTVRILLQIGSPGDFPVPGDYDGDKMTDIAVWSPGDGKWSIYESGTPFGPAALKFDIHGDPNDIPIAKYYLP